MGEAKHTITPRLSLASTQPFPVPPVIPYIFVLWPHARQEAHQEAWQSPLAGSGRKVVTLTSFVTKLYHLLLHSDHLRLPPSLSKPRSFVCHQSDVWHVLCVAFDKIVRVTGNWTEGGISLFEWSKLHSNIEIRYCINKPLQGIAQTSLPQQECPSFTSCAILRSPL